MALDHPRVFLHHPKALTEAKAALASGNPQLAEAVAGMRCKADQQMAAGPWSVMDKPVTPPSGDRHDYMSHASYWWPDPATPGGKPYIRKDGETNPEGDKLDKIPLARMCEAVTTLAAAYYFSGREAYAERAATLLRVWFLDERTRMNPHLEYGQSVPGLCDGRAEGIIDTRLLVPVVDAIGMLGASPSWTQGDEEGMQRWAREYLTWLLDSDKGKEEAEAPNNHGTWYDVQAAILAVYCGEDAIAKRVVHGSRKRIAGQIEPDGSQPWELKRARSLHYTVLNLTGWFHLALLGERFGWDLWNHQTADGRGIRRALDWLVPYFSGERAWSKPDIRPFGPDEVVPVLRLGAIKYRDVKYEQLLHSMKQPPSQEALHQVDLTYPLQR